MSEKQIENSIKKLFKQNSELEVLLSAAVIFAALSLNDTIIKWINIALNNNISGGSTGLIFLAIVGLYMSTILPISIVIHFVLRVYWLSLVGIRSAFDDKEISTERFNGYFQSRIEKYSSLEHQINRIDKISSSIFAFTFLVLFAFVFAFGVLILIIAAINLLPFNLGYLVVVIALLGVIDFFSFGWFKSINHSWFRKIYVPFYWMFSILTLSFLYRGLYYGLTGYVNRKLLMVGLPLYIACGIFLFNLGYYPDGLYPPEYLDQEIRGEEATSIYYANRLTEDYSLQTPYIQSRIIPMDQNYLVISIPITAHLQDSLLSTCTDVKPFNKSGPHWNRYAKFDFTKIDYNVPYGDNARGILACMRDLTTVSIDDSLYQTSTFVFTSRSNPKRRLLQTILPIPDLKAGEHVLKLTTPTLSWIDSYYIPFYKDR
jgi:hypothetical protein